MRAGAFPPKPAVGPLSWHRIGMPNHFARVKQRFPEVVATQPRWKGRQSAVIWPYEEARTPIGPHVDTRRSSGRYYPDGQRVYAWPALSNVLGFWRSFAGNYALSMGAGAGRFGPHPFRTYFTASAHCDSRYPSPVAVGAHPGGAGAVWRHPVWWIYASKSLRVSASVLMR